MVRLNINIVGISDLNWTEMGEFHSDDHYIYHCGQVSLRRNGAALIVPLESPKFGTWTQPQKQQNDLSSFPGKTIQHHCRSSLHPNHWCERSWSWLLLWTPTTPRTSTREDILFYVCLYMLLLLSCWVIYNFCDSTDCRLPSPSVHGISQALEYRMKQGKG